MLQILAAPVSVEFFPAEIQRLSHKDSLVRDFHANFRISVQPLQGSSEGQLSVDKRM